jgi:hypothetical protein
MTDIRELEEADGSAAVFMYIELKVAAKWQ